MAAMSITARPDNPTVELLRGSHDVVDTFVLFCEKHGIACASEDLESSLKVCVLLSLICPDVKDLCLALVPDTFIPWDSIGMEAPVFEANPTVWIGLMQHFKLDAGVKDEQVAAESGDPMPAALCTFFKLLNQASISMTYEHAARLFVLCNVRQLSMSALVTLYNQQYNAATNSTAAQRFVGKYADSRASFERAPCYDAILWVLGHLSVSTGFIQHVNRYRERRSSTQNRVLIRTALMSEGRLRLRSRLATLAITNPTNIFNDSFTSWCMRVRLPLSLGKFLKKKLYFLRAQAFDVTDAVHELTSPEVAKLIMETPIHDPDIDVIDLVISRLLLTKKPFKDMAEFGIDVIPVGSASAIVRSMPNPLLFQLYVAAYQPVYWRANWMHLHPELASNHVVISNVERRVSNHPICVAEVLPYIISAGNNFSD